MPPSDCGCSGLVTPTLDELLAVARAKPLPRLSVTERRPPPANVGASLKGWLEWRLVDRRGREVAGGEGPNLILDQGLDQIASTELLVIQGTAGFPPTFFPLIRYAAVGTDSSTPDPGDLGLGSEVARTGTTFAPETLTRPAPGVYRLTRFIEFGYEEANGVLTEWGFSSEAASGSNLFNRALFTDAGGTPDAITKTDQEKLRLTYTLEVSLSPVSLTPGSFTLAGVGVVNGEYMLVGGPPPTSVSQRCRAQDLTLFSALARGVAATAASVGFFRFAVGSAAVDPTDRSGAAYTDLFMATANGGDGAGNAYVYGNDLVTTPRDAYTPGSFSREGGAWGFDTSRGNTGSIFNIQVSGAGEVPSGGSGTGACDRAGYIFSLDAGDRFMKDDEHRLTVGMPTVTWGRAP